jgi:hypothetical protein
MDFFETRERYRRREMRSYVSLLFRVLVVGGVLWLGWLWGHAETGSLRAEAERTLYENNQQIAELSTELQRLDMELAEARAKNKVDELAEDNDAELKALVTKKIARGVAPAQIIHAIQKLGRPSNCRQLETLNIAVATPLYGGPESKAMLFDGALNLHVEGEADRKSSREVPSFDRKMPLTVRMAFLNGQKVTEGTLPFQAMIPAEDWVLLLDFADSTLHGYVTATISSCTQR